MGAAGKGEVRLAGWCRWWKERRRSWRWKQWCEEEGEGAPAAWPEPQLHEACGSSVDAPGAAGDQLGAGDLLACLESRLDGGLVGREGGFDAEPLGIEQGLVLDLDRL